MTAILQKPALTLSTIAAVLLTATSPAMAAPPNAPEQRVVDSSKLSEAAIAEDRQKAENKHKAEQAIQAKIESEKAATVRLAEMERVKLRQRQQEAEEKKCVIKPVMSDAEIAVCKSAWR